MPVEGCDRRRWSGLQRVVRDFQRGPSEQALAKRHSALGRLTALTWRDASLARQRTANPGENTSVSASNDTLLVGVREVLLYYSLNKYVATAGSPVEQSEVNCVVEPANVLQRSDMLHREQQSEYPVLRGSIQSGA